MTEEIKQPETQPSSEASPPPQDTVPLNAATGAAEPSPGQKTSEAPEKKPESRFKRFLRRLLWTLVGVFVVFAAGFITAWMIFYRPLEAQKRSLEQQLQQIQEEKAALEVTKADLETKLQDAQARLADLEDQAKTIAAERDQAQTLQYLLSALADTYAAQLALDAENPTSARLHLSNVQASLRLLAERLPEQKEVFTEMNQRVDKAMQTLTTSPLTAQGELTALADYFLQLKNLITKK